MLIIATAMGPLSRTQKSLCPGLKSCLNTLKYVVTGALWHITSIGLEEKDSKSFWRVFSPAVLLHAYFVTFFFFIFKQCTHELNLYHAFINISTLFWHHFLKLFSSSLVKPLPHVLLLFLHRVLIHINTVHVQCWWWGYWEGDNTAAHVNLGYFLVTVVL